jgi:phosphotransferase system enzyme I (PtsI)
LRSLVLEGIAGSVGYAIAPAVVVDVRRHGVVRRHVPKRAADDEMARFDRAVKEAALSLREVAERARPRIAEVSILEAYILMVQDETLREDVERRVRIDLQCAEWALRSSVVEMGEQLRGGFIIPLIALIAIILGICAGTNVCGGDDDDLPHSP